MILWSYDFIILHLVLRIKFFFNFFKISYIRHQVIYALPELKFLDSTQITVHEKTEAKRVGPYLKVARPQVILII